MQEIRYGIIDEKKIPVLISDETEALLAAKTAGMASVGLCREADGEECPGGTDMVVLDSRDIDEELLERAARRALRLPWNICNTGRLMLREIETADYDRILSHPVGENLDSREKLESYVKHQYPVYGFGLWAVVEKETECLCGIAGVSVPQDSERLSECTAPVLQCELTLELDQSDDRENDGNGNEDLLELGYYIFPEFRNRGYAKEACLGILSYVKEKLGVSRFWVRIEKKNVASIRLAKSLRFQVIQT